MAETLSSKRWSGRMLAIAVLVSIAIGMRLAASGGAASATNALDRQGVSAHSESAAVHHVQSKWRGDVVRSGGPLPAQLLAGGAIATRQSRALPRRGVAFDDAAATGGYDATAPPRSLLT